MNFARSACLLNRLPRNSAKFTTREQPPAAPAIKGSPSNMIPSGRMGTLSVSSCKLSPTLLARNAPTSKYAVTMLSAAPMNPRDAAVTAESVRRERRLAPAAVRARSSDAVSERMRPTVIASTPSANDTGADRPHENLVEGRKRVRCFNACADRGRDGARRLFLQCSQ
jgi:hypothetical protein